MSITASTRPGWGSSAILSPGPNFALLLCLPPQVPRCSPCPSAHRAASTLAHPRGRSPPGAPCAELPIRGRGGMLGSGGPGSYLRLWAGPGRAGREAAGAALGPAGRSGTFVGGGGRRRFALSASTA